MVNILLVVERVYYLHDIKFVGHVICTSYIQVEKLAQVLYSCTKSYIPRQ
jgi:hypothetical protein